MVYSCFNQSTGYYDVYKDDSQRPFNGDLPVPTLGEEVQNIGVPANDAGRPLPGKAKFVGTSWSAHGILVNCNQRSMSGFLERKDEWIPPLMIGVGIVTIGYILLKS